MPQVVNVKDGEKHNNLKVGINSRKEPPEVMVKPMLEQIIVQNKT